MSFPNKRKPLALNVRDRQTLEALSKSRTAPYAQVKRARILLRYSKTESINSIAKNERTSRPTVGRCIDKALSESVMVALRDFPRPGRPPLIGEDDKAWVIKLVCSKPSEYGYAADHWTYSLLVAHIRKNCLKKGHPALAKVSKSVLHKIIGAANIKPSINKLLIKHKVQNPRLKTTRILGNYNQNHHTVCFRCGEPTS